MFLKVLLLVEMFVLNGVWIIIELDFEFMCVCIVNIVQGEMLGSFDIIVVENNLFKYEVIDNGVMFILQNMMVLDLIYFKLFNL